MSKQILLGTSVFQKYKRQDLCISAFKALSKNISNVECCLIQHPDDDVLYEDINCFRDLKRNCRSAMHTTKNIPFVNDIFDCLSKRCDDIFVFCNSDIILTPTLIQYINSIEHVEAFGISRTDIAEIDSINHPARMIRNEPAGFDCWVISKNWWNRYKHKFEDFLIGRPFFDVMYTMLMSINSSNTYVSDREIIYHVMHKQVSFQEDECFMFNKNQKIKYYEYLEQLWAQCTEATYAKRRDFGTFFEYIPSEQGIINNIVREFKQCRLDQKRKNVLFNEEFVNAYAPTQNKY